VSVDVWPPKGSTLPQRIRAAAARLFQVNGYGGVTIDDIVNEVGATKGGFYHYFPSKAELLLSLHEEYVTFSVERFRAAIEAAQPSPKRELEAFVHESFRQIHEHQEYVGLLFDERRSLQGNGAEDLNATKAGLRALLASVIERGSSEGVFRPGDSHAMAVAIFGACTWGYSWYRPDGRVGHEELARQFAELAWRGLAANPDEET
jgi:TetR/AcrR family transcriptional regulator, cholesterol catabolism regulator